MSNGISENRKTSKSLDIPTTFVYQKGDLLVYAHLREHSPFGLGRHEDLISPGATECLSCGGEFYAPADGISMTVQDHALRTRMEAVDLWRDGPF
jgi:hypothetical protein